MKPPAYRGAFNRWARRMAKYATVGVVRGLAPRRYDLPLTSWRLVRDANGALLLDGVPLEGLLRRWGSPLHVVDGARLMANTHRFQARSPRASRACEVYYSYKTNPVRGVLKHIHDAGVGAEVISHYELWLALGLGVPARSVVYNGPAKSRASEELAVDRGVGLFNINSCGEIAPLAQVARNAGKRIRVGVRVVAPGCLGGQLGERIDTGAALEAFREALRFPELEVVALHSHYNGEISSAPQLAAYFEALLAFTDTLRDALKLELEIIDVGGNLACPTVNSMSTVTRQLGITFGIEPVPRPPQSVLDIDAYVRQVQHTVEGHYHAQGRLAPRIFLEPGRALTGNAQLLLSRVVSVREPDDIGMRWVVLDAGINVAEEVRGKQHQLFAVQEAPSAPRHTYRIAGPSCMLGDLLYPAWRLPLLSVGDALAVMDSGAYFIPYSTCFSNPRPAVVMLDENKETLLRRAETFDDLMALDQRTVMGSERPTVRLLGPVEARAVLEGT